MASNSSASSSTFLPDNRSARAVMPRRSPITSSRCRLEHVKVATAAAGVVGHAGGLRRRLGDGADPAAFAEPIEATPMRLDELERSQLGPGPIAPARRPRQADRRPGLRDRRRSPRRSAAWTGTGALGLVLALCDRALAAFRLRELCAAVARLSSSWWGSWRFVIAAGTHPRGPRLGLRRRGDQHPDQE